MYIDNNHSSQLNKSNFAQHANQPWASPVVKPYSSHLPTKLFIATTIITTIVLVIIVVMVSTSLILPSLHVPSLTHLPHWFNKAINFTEYLNSKYLKLVIGFATVAAFMTCVATHNLVAKLKIKIKLQKEVERFLISNYKIIERRLFNNNEIEIKYFPENHVVQKCR